VVDRSDLYVVLQVDPGAETDVIKAAYRTLAAKHHPDVGGSADWMAELNNAWSVLSDAASRRAYDQQRRLRLSGGRWDASVIATPSSPGPSWGRILEYGRFAGWSIPQVAKSDPDYLEWFVRTPNGRRVSVGDRGCPRAVDACGRCRRRPTAIAQSPPLAVGSAASDRRPSWERRLG